MSRPIRSPAIEKLLLEIEGQAVKTKPKITTVPKNYTKENIRRLKEIQDTCKRKEIDIKTPVKALPIAQSSASKIPAPLPSSRIAATGPSPSDTPLRIEGVKKSTTTFGRETQPKNLLRRSQITNGLQKTTTPSSSGASSALRRSASFREPKIQSNPNSVQLALGRRSSLSRMGSFKEDSPKQNLPHLPGTIPKYLIARRQKWKEEADEKKKIADRDPTIPPGHTLMSDEERKQTLALLEKTHEELLKRLISLPVQLSTLRAKNEKEEIESKLKKAEEGIEIFSRPRVLIKHDDI